MSVIRRHLYDPATDTHYLNGGFLAADADVPLEGAQWLEGFAPKGSAVFEPPVKVSTRIDRKLQNAIATLNDPSNIGAIDPGPGVMYQIAELARSLRELAGMVPDQLYARDAKLVIEQLPPLPELLEPLKQDILDELNAELGQ